MSDTIIATTSCSVHTTVAKPPSVWSRGFTNDITKVFPLLARYWVMFPLVTIWWHSHLIKDRFCSSLMCYPHPFKWISWLDEPAINRKQNTDLWAELASIFWSLPFCRSQIPTQLRVRVAPVYALLAKLMYSIGFSCLSIAYTSSRMLSKFHTWYWGKPKDGKVIQIPSWIALI